MKTLAEVKEFLGALGVEYVEEPSELRQGKTRLRCAEGMKGVGGYTAFYTTFEFDADDKFVELGAWE